jgi:hypothetical protein
MKLLLFFLAIAAIKSDAVCSLKTLKVELRQDLKDNGVLDCLRRIEPKHFVEETETERNLRIAAQWDTSCAFESEAKWRDLLKINYEIDTLVDVYGEPMKDDSDDQADMCEIVRAMMQKALGKFIKLDDVDEKAIELKKDFIEKIGCLGSDSEDSHRICAASGSSYFQKNSWSIFLYSSNIKVN